MREVFQLPITEESDIDKTFPPAKVNAQKILLCKTHNINKSKQSNL